MSQATTFEIGIAGVVRPAAGIRDAVMAPGAWQQLRSGATSGGRGRVCPGAGTGR